jgi:hypothetical protein
MLSSAQSWAFDAELERTIETRIVKLAAIKNKSFDDLVQLALLNRKLSDERVYAKWLASAAAAKPSEAFTTDRSPFVYVRVWSIPVPDDEAYLRVQKAGDDAFYASVVDASARNTRGWAGPRIHMRGVDRFDPLMQEVRQIRIAEAKADFATSLDVDYDGRFHFGNFGIVFSFSPQGEYLGQIVTMHRNKSPWGNTLFRKLGGGDAYMSDRLRHISRINKNADTVKFMELKCGRDAMIAGMAADKDENLFVGLVGDNQIVMLKPDLTERCRIGGTGMGPGQALCLVDLDVSNQSIIIVDPVLRRIKVFDKNGAYLMQITANAFSASINSRGTIVALEGNRVTCYARYIKDPRPEPDAEFMSYLEAVELMEKGEHNEARKLLQPLTQSADLNLAQVSESLMQHDTLALTRHYQRIWPLTKDEIERMTGRKVKEIFLDPYRNCTWASPADGFLVRVDEFERVTSFELFEALHGMTGDLRVQGMRMYEYWCYAATNHGICRYSRKHGDWQFLPDVKSLDDVQPEGE